MCRDRVAYVSLDRALILARRARNGTRAYELLHNMYIGSSLSHMITGKYTHTVLWSILHGGHVDIDQSSKTTSTLTRLSNPPRGIPTWRRSRSPTRRARAVWLVRFSVCWQSEMETNVGLPKRIAATLTLNICGWSCRASQTEIGARQRVAFRGDSAPWR